MSSLDSIAGIVVGVYLLVVVTKGRSKDLITLAKRDRDFLQWATALMFLAYLYSIPELKGITSMLIFAAFVGLAITSGPKISANVKSFWGALGRQSSGASGSW